VSESVGVGWLSTGNITGRPSGRRASVGWMDTHLAAAAANELIKTTPSAAAAAAACGSSLSRQHHMSLSTVVKTFALHAHVISLVNDGQ